MCLKSVPVLDGRLPCKCRYPYKTCNTAGIIGYLIIHIQGIAVEGRMIGCNISGTFNRLRAEDGTAILFCILCKLHIIDVCCLGS